MTPHMTAMTLDAFFAQAEWSADPFADDEALVASIPIVVRARDGYPLAATLAMPPRRPKAVVVLASAMGVRRGYYAPFARYLAAAGLATLTLDYRGIGDSRAIPLRDLRTTLHDWAELDLAAAVDEARARVPGAPLLWVGHSVGGQLMGLVPGANVDAALFVGSQSGYWRHWEGAARMKIASLWHALIPGLVTLAGYFPSPLLGMGESLPAGVAREWARWGRDPGYLLVHARERGGAELARYAGPLRALAFTDDGFAPERAVHALVDCYPFARRDVAVIRPRDVGARRIGHFGFFRAKFRNSLWKDARSWLLRQSGSGLRTNPEA